MRRNVNSLNKEEKSRLVRAMNRLIKSGKYADLGNIHGDPPQICYGHQDGHCCRHDSALLPWHRLYMAQMEEELGEPLPYWDWTADKDVPDLWEEIRAPIKSPNTSICDQSKPYTTRKPNSNFNQSILVALKKDVKEALGRDNFGEFEIELNNPHGGVHIMLGCDMGHAGTAAYDPVFYLHHTFVDLVWAYWQQLQQLRQIKEQYVPQFDEPLAPFNRPGFNHNAKTLKHNKGRDVVDYKNSLCYEYEDLRIDGKTPAQFLEDKDNFFDGRRQKSSSDSFLGLFRTAKVLRPGKCREVCKGTAGQNDNCETVCAADKDGKSFVKVYVGIVLPRIAPSGANTFDLCQRGQCVKGGVVNTFGFGSNRDDAKIRIQEVADDKDFYLLETDVTDVLGKESWSFKKPLVAKMTSSVVSNLPEPVVIIKKLGEGGKVISGDVVFSPHGKPERYGDMLHKYSS